MAGVGGSAGRVAGVRGGPQGGKNLSDSRGEAPCVRGIVPFTHLTREGRMTVTIGRRELLAALGGAAAARA